MSFLSRLLGIEPDANAKGPAIVSASTSTIDKLPDGPVKRRMNSYTFSDGFIRVFWEGQSYPTLFELSPFRQDSFLDSPELYMFRLFLERHPEGGFEVQMGDTLFEIGPSSANRKRAVDDSQDLHEANEQLQEKFETCKKGHARLCDENQSLKVQIASLKDEIKKKEDKAGDTYMIVDTARVGLPTLITGDDAYERAMAVGYSMAQQDHGYVTVWKAERIESL